MFKITQDRKKCIGCGACVSVCPDNWVMAKDGKAKPKKSKSDLDCNQAAADGCPVHCIHVKKV